MSESKLLLILQRLDILSYKIHSEFDRLWGAINTIETKLERLESKQDACTHRLCKD